MESKLTINNGTKEWKLPNGDFHRESGPAIEYSYGYKAWYIDDKRHREDGPPVEWGNGTKEWYLNDIKYTESEYKCEMRSRKMELLLHQRHSNPL